MCTAVTFNAGDCYFGRNLDYEYSFGEEIVIMPRKYKLKFTEAGTLGTHYAIIGIAHVENGYPLFYDAANERGLAAAGLNFAGNAVYHTSLNDRTNAAQFEFLPWVLSQSGNIREARALIEKTCITPTPFCPQLPPSSLHWIFADKSGSITVESVKDGIKIYDNPAGVLTNNPPFDMQLFNLNNYLHISAETPDNTFSSSLSLGAYSRGMGGLGLPGDLSSQSRFVRAAFAAANSVTDGSEFQNAGQMFHILGYTAQPRGCCAVDGGKYEITLYTSCCNADKGIYYCTTYGNRRITAVDMHAENLDGDTPIRYAIPDTEDMLFLNKR